MNGRLYTASRDLTRQQIIAAVRESRSEDNGRIVVDLSRSGFLVAEIIEHWPDIIRAAQERTQR